MSKWFNSTPEPANSEALYYAAKSGNLTEVETKLNQGKVDINFKMPNVGNTADWGYTPLTIAIKNRNVPIAEYLIKNGADIHGENIFRNAIYGKLVPIVELLIKKGVIVDKEALFYALYSHNVKIVKMILDTGVDVNIVNEYGHTILYKAVFLDNNVEIIKMLINKGADIDAENKTRTNDDENNRPIITTPLWLATKKGKIEVVKALLDGRTNIDNGNPGFFTSFKNRFTSNRGNVPVAALGATTGADVNKAVGYYKFRPIHIASRNGDVEIVKLLIQKGADVNMSAGDGSTPLNKAVLTKNNTEVVKVLIDGGADVNTENNLENEYKTPLNQAINENNTEVVKVLIARGADVKGGYRPPLHTASENKNAEIVELLLKNGADVDEMFGSYTPLHMAVRKTNNAEVIKILLAGGADINIQNNDGKTAFSLASPEIKNLFIENETEIWKQMAEQGHFDEIDYKDEELKNLYAKFQSEALASHVSGLLNHKVGMLDDGDTENDLFESLVNDLVPPNDNNYKKEGGKRRNKRKTNKSRKSRRNKSKTTRRKTNKSKTTRRKTNKSKSRKSRTRK